MPVSVVVGGQFGSEGKGKVAYEFSKLRNATAAVRVGGPNSGHSVSIGNGEVIAFQQLPTAALLPNTISIIAPGSYVDAEILLREVDMAKLSVERLLIDERAMLIRQHHRSVESSSGLSARIGSTGSGTGAAVQARIARSGDAPFVSEDERLRPFIGDTSTLMRSLLSRQQRIVVEGTQGFGLSVLHSESYPYVTSRDTTAAGFLAEAGLSPLDVDEVVMTIRAHPIRVGGNSGPLPNETTWEEITKESGSRVDLREFTTVTKKLRRIARFDSKVVLAAIARNRPTKVVLNHLDYIDADCRETGAVTAKASKFVRDVEIAIGQRIDFVGISPATMLPPRHEAKFRVV
jgi:adenylosuccinate synthase